MTVRALFVQATPCRPHRRNGAQTTVDGHTAVLTYRHRDERPVLVHTEVPDALVGQGIGSALVSAAVDHAAEHDLTLVPRCPFARDWLARHLVDARRVRVEPTD